MSLLPHWSSQHTSLFHSLTRAPRWLIHALLSLLKSLSNSLPTFTDVRAFKLTKKIEPKKKKKPQKKLSTCSHHYTHLPTCFFAYMLSHPSCYPEELSEFLPKANPRPVDQISFLFASLRITQAISPSLQDHSISVQTDVETSPILELGAGGSTLNLTSSSSNHSA